MSESSAMIGSYATLVGLCNVSLSDMGSEMVKELAAKLQECLQKGDFRRAKILVKEKDIFGNVDDEEKDVITIFFF
jgi:hypothetical protein